jgi:hypothetical protein
LLDVIRADFGCDLATISTPWAISRLVPPDRRTYAYELAVSACDLAAPRCTWASAAYVFGVGSEDWVQAWY